MAETNGDSTTDRLVELERENARLREALARAEVQSRADRVLLNTLIAETLPKTDEEMLQLIADSRPSDELFAELEREFGPFPRETGS